MIFQCELMAVIPQPGSADLIVRQDACYHIPEIFGMIHISQMAELVNNNIVQYSGGSENKPIVKGQSSTGGAASPAAFLISYGYRGVASSSKPVVEFNSLCKADTGSIPITLFKYVKTLLLSGRERNEERGI